MSQLLLYDPFPKNPYAQPMRQPGFGQHQMRPSSTKIVAPGIALIVVGVLGLIMSSISIVVALVVASLDSIQICQIG